MSRWETELIHGRFVIRSFPTDTGARDYRLFEIVREGGMRTTREVSRGHHDLGSAFAALNTHSLQLGLGPIPLSA